MTSSTKPEVHSILHCRHRGIELRLQVTSTENVGIVSTCVALNMQAGSQAYTDMVIAILCICAWGGERVET